ncbi:WD40 repeat-like protein [Ceratobasidium sp. AG-I]|nr:WD40 repeat-like protein [Ceratobasidium sp. AG-I]
MSHGLSTARRGSPMDGLPHTPKNSYPTALPAEAGPFTPGTRTSREKLGANKRKKTIIDLIDQLTELREEGDENERDAKYPLAVEEHPLSNNEEVQHIRVFDERARSLDRKLLAFANAVRPLGSSVGLINAASCLRKRLAQIQYIFLENAAKLFGPISHNLNLGTKPYRTRRQEKVRRHTSLPQSNNSGNPWLSDAEHVPAEHVPYELEFLAEDLLIFLDHINDTSGFPDEAVNNSITAFEGDLQYQSSCLQEFAGQLESVDVARYINNLTEDLRGHMDSLETSLHIFIETVVPQLLSSQERTAAGLLNLSAVATFFSGVTATTLQGLVLSIASAINSQLAYHWLAAMYRSPRCCVPWWADIWITRTPLIFLAMSVIAFSVGLCGFTYSSSQSPTVSAVVMSFVGITSFALLCVGLWFASERWTYAQTRGNKWLLDVLEDTVHKIERATRAILDKLTTSRAVLVAIKCTRSFVDKLMHAPAKVVHHIKDVSTRMKEAIALMVNVPRVMLARTVNSLAVITNGLTTNDQADVESQDNIVRTDSPKPMPITRAPPDLDATPSLAYLTSPEPAEVSTEKNARFKAAVRQVIASFRIDPPAYTPYTRDLSEQRMNPTRLQALVPVLRTLRSTQMLDEHVSLVKHLQFSPDGQFLATCSWDKTALIWRVGSSPSEDFTVLHKLVHISKIGGFVEQVAWSPTGDRLLTKQLQGVKIWDTKTGDCKKTIRRKHKLRSVGWMPTGSGFVLVEWRLDANSTEAGKQVHCAENIQGSDLVFMTADGTVTNDHYLPRLQVWDAAVTPNESRIVAVASLLSSKDNLKPTKSRNEKRILVYNLQTKEIENQVPLLQDIKDITLTERGDYALVSYGSRSPPQAWRIDMIAKEEKCRLVLAHTYFTKHPVDFAGSSYFGGVNDVFVLSVSKGGEIYIWERASGMLLHSLKAPDQELTNIAWSHKSPCGFMLASAAHDGIVRIWTTTVRPAASQPSRSLASLPETGEADEPSSSRIESSRSGSPPMANLESFSSLQ